MHVFGYFLCPITNKVWSWSNQPRLYHLIISLQCFCVARRSPQQSKNQEGLFTFYLPKCPTVISVVEIIIESIYPFLTKIHSAVFSEFALQGTQQSHLSYFASCCIQRCQHWERKDATTTK